MPLDDSLLEKARDVRSRVLELQHDADRARLEYHHAIRRLHAAGGSMREIAEALDLSHQRVHQIVEGDEPIASRLGWPRARRTQPRLRGTKWLGLRRFTRGARRVVMQAQKEAHRLGAEEISPEHLLLGLVASERGGAAHALAACGVDLESVLRELGAQPVREPARGHLPFTRESKAVLERSLREAVTLGHNWIGSEHVLLALLAEGGRPVEVLEKLGAGPDALREATARVLDPAA